MNNSKTVNIDSDLHKKLKKYCSDNNLKINELINELIDDRISIKEKSILPLILKDKGEVYENIICSEMSPEYRNSLPKSLTLIRSSKDGTVFIATYKQV